MGICLPFSHFCEAQSRKQDFEATMQFCQDVQNGPDLTTASSKDSGEQSEMIHPGLSRDTVFEIGDDPTIDLGPDSFPIRVTTGLWCSQYLGGNVAFQIRPAGPFFLSDHCSLLQD